METIRPRLSHKYVIQEEPNDVSHPTVAILRETSFSIHPQQIINSLLNNIGWSFHCNISLKEKGVLKRIYFNFTTFQMYRAKMNKPVITILFLSIFQVFVQSGMAQPQAERGILNLKEQELNQTLSLNGEWEFYWKVLLMADPEKKDTISPVFVRVPSYWTSYKDSISNVSRFGYGSYRLRVLLPALPGDSLSLKIPVFDTSYELYLDGRLIFANGEVGSSKTLSEPGYLPYIHSFPAGQDTLEIIVHVSNYFHRAGGFWLDMQLGKKETVLKQNEKRKIIAYALTGILFGAFLLFFSFYLLDRSNLSFLFFSISALGFLLRLLYTDLFPGFYLFETSWLWIVRLEYAGTFCGLAFGILYLDQFYPSSIMRKASYINASIFMLLILFVLFSKPYIFGYSIYVVFIAGPLFLTYFLYRSFLKMIHGNIRDGVLFISIILVLLASINDTLVSQSLSPFKFEYLVSYTFLLFIAVQVLLLITTWINNYREKTHMYNELQHVNENLESIVQIRTNELTQTNQELEKTLSIKNRIYSIIAHDLKSPVATLAQYADLIAERSANDENRKIVHELQKLSYSSIDLIENMLQWGLQQDKHIQYNPDMVPVSTVVHEVMKLTEIAASDKKISMKVNIENELAVYCDQSVLNISLRNLLTNAIKFTPDNGRITIDAFSDREKVVLKVTDTGVGMDAEQVEKILSDMASPTRGTAGERGTGIGLLVVKDLVKLNKGAFSIESKPGRGTFVMLTLPGKP